MAVGGEVREGRDQRRRGLACEGGPRSGLGGDFPGVPTRKHCHSASRGSADFTLRTLYFNRKN